MTTSKENGVTYSSTIAASSNDTKIRNTSSKVCRMLTPSEIKDLQQNKRESIQKMRELLDGNVFL
ncbi:hypothetical protein FK216_01710 [Moraxellaceae bacterium AER2_44_116]|nr:hypothetical protein [Moraxellaceae bacterium]TQC99989.1 hypothetical protein FK216_01710 [Moraxellaceae bacterium AER2_44_116]